MSVIYQLQFIIIKVDKNNIRYVKLDIEQYKLFNTDMENKRLQKDFMILKSYIKNTYMDDDAILFPCIETNKSFDDAFLDINNFSVIMKGPPDSPYENGEFKFVITIPPRYPYVPPVIKCETKIYHPNIKSSGICVETLQDGWSPSFGLKQVLMSIYAVMFIPNKHEGPVKSITSNEIKSHEEFLTKATATVDCNNKLII